VHSTSGISCGRGEYLRNFAGRSVSLWQLTRPTAAICPLNARECVRSIQIRCWVWGHRSSRNFLHAGRVLFHCMLDCGAVHEVAARRMDPSEAFRRSRSGRRGQRARTSCSGTSDIVDGAGSREASAVLLAVGNYVWTGWRRRCSSEPWDIFVCATATRC